MILLSELFTVFVRKLESRGIPSLNRKGTPKVPKIAHPCWSLALVPWAQVLVPLTTMSSTVRPSLD